MHILDLIEKKKSGIALDANEIAWFVQAYVAGEVADYQAAALLMAIRLVGAGVEETYSLTKAMVESGSVFDPTGISRPLIDKHSTGGVGDKVTLVLAPILAACGAGVAKMSGRGLGHTGGTLDKLESIPGFRTHLTLDELRAQVERVGCAVVGQSDDMVVADKKLYALRDVTGTVDSPSLIAASVLSKKIAGGSPNIVVDVKVGRGAFLTTLDAARDFARQLTDLAGRFGRRLACVFTAMDQPLGRAVGNAVEVIEAMNVLRGNAFADLMEVVTALGAKGLAMAGLAVSEDDARGIMHRALESGSAFAKFEEMVAAQGGDLAAFKKMLHRPTVNRLEFRPESDGYIASIDALRVGELVRTMGGGRYEKDDVIDPMACVVFRRKVGDRVVCPSPDVTEGDEDKCNVVALLKWNRGISRDEAYQAMREAVRVERKPPARPPVILG
jgi:pyrimidine-nucleoside phosphorylase